MELSKVDDHDEGLLVDKVLRDDDLRGAEVAHEVPRLPVERLPLEDAVQSPQKLLLRLLLRLLQFLKGRGAYAPRREAVSVELLGYLEEVGDALEDGRIVKELSSMN